MVVVGSQIRLFVVLLVRPLAGLAVVLAGLLPSQAYAEWKSVQQVTLGTAQVLEQGALTFGVLAPLAFGVTNRLTLQSHPILDLLLVPNVTGRYRVLDGRNWILSAAGGFKRSYFQPAGLATGEAAESPGEANVGATATKYLGRNLALTGSLYYSAYFDAPYQGGFEPLTHGVATAAEVHWLLGPADLLIGSVYLRQDLSLGPTGCACCYCRLGSRFLTFLGGAHLILGLTAGDTTTATTGPLVGRPAVFPMVDLWWRL
jgi:hypothetical protein